LQLVPGNRDLRMNVALAYYKEQKLTEAANQFAPLLQEEAHLRLGCALYQQRKLDEAQKQLERALQIDPTSSYARCEPAKAQNAQGQTEAALKNFEAVSRAIPEWLLPHVELAALYLKLKRPEDSAREKGIVDRISEQERQKKTKSPVISPQLPSR
jgi:tetratricopeptide (TPR) repeat protein